MNNIVSMRGDPIGNAQATRSVISGDGHSSSPLLFEAYERPLYYKGKHGDEYSNTGHKALVRMYKDEPVTLNVVRDTYKVVQNAELFENIHNGLLVGISEREIASARIKDKLSYFGAVCFREYIFPDISIESPERDKIAFRIVIQNGFGTGSIKLLAGAIDFFCTNGLVIGEYTSTYAKHTKGLQISKFKEAVEGSVHMFWKNKDMYNELADTKVLSDEKVLAWYTDKFGERLGERLFHQYAVETKKRGRTLWAVYSALTYYSSHAVGDFTLRQTGNDHTASTMMKRENDVRRIVNNGNGLKELAA